VPAQAPALSTSGAASWLRLLSEWAGPAGQVVGTDIDDAMLALAARFVTGEGLANVTLKKDDVFATSLEPASFDLVHARYEITPLGRAATQMKTYLGLVRPAESRPRRSGCRLVALQPSRAGAGGADRARRGGIPPIGRRLGFGGSTSTCSAVSASTPT